MALLQRGYIHALLINSSRSQIGFTCCSTATNLEYARVIHVHRSFAFDIPSRLTFRTRDNGSLIEVDLWEKPGEFLYCEFFIQSKSQFEIKSRCMIRGIHEKFFEDGVMKSVTLDILDIFVLGSLKC